MKKKKIFILLPDGIGLRNFAYSSFNEIGKNNEFEIIYWNNTLFPLKSLGFDEIKIENAKTHPLTDIFKVVKIHVTLNHFKKKTLDKIYDSYKFPFHFNNIKSAIKSTFSILLIKINSGEKDLEKLSNKINKQERKTLYYHQSKVTLEKEKPDLVFCTNQRQILSVAPLLAAKDLNIPTASFIFSWDNLPKATLIVETDYYFVWSQFMKEEMMFYYPKVNEKQIIITGTPQFEMHFDKSKLLNRETFFSEYGLDLNKKYICFSGDDFTSSPDDEKYLEDFALAVKNLNYGNCNYGIIFRRCPVDFSDRYNIVLEKYKDIIVPIDPLWKPLTSHWNTVLPTKEDDILFSSLAEHTELVVNLGSSTVFDFVSHKKPCGYFRYNQRVRLNKKWDIFNCYKFVHFRSMFSNNSVFWMDNPNEIQNKLEQILEKDTSEIIKNAQKWFEIINQHPPEKASERIWNAIEKITTR
ncbi:MAG: UDP-glycosyltransferase [Flavobacterium sp.]|nr:UDP-glycosyltransferase [Flavobacterium sp.]